MLYVKFSYAFKHQLLWENLTWKVSRTLYSKHNNMQRQLQEKSSQNKSLISKSLRKDHLSLPHKGSFHIAENCQAVAKIETHSLVWFSMTCRILWMPNVAAQKLPAGRDPSKTTAVMSWRLGSAAALRWAGASCFGGRSPSVRSSLWSAFWQIVVLESMDHIKFNFHLLQSVMQSQMCPENAAKQTTLELYCQWQNRWKCVSTSVSISCTTSISKTTALTMVVVMLAYKCLRSTSISMPMWTCLHCISLILICNQWGV